MSQRSLKDFTPTDKMPVNVLMAATEDKVITATPPPSTENKPQIIPYKSKCEEPGCRKYLMSDGRCHNEKCRREQRIMSMIKLKGTPQQRVDAYQAFRRFLAE